MANGMCKCGCGQITTIAKRTSKRDETIKGEHIKFIHGHNSRFAHPMLGKKHSETTRKKLSDSHKGQIPWISGKQHTEKSRIKMRMSHLGVPLSPEHNKNVHEARKRNGYRHSEETLKKIGLGNKGKIISEESKRKISESCKKVWENHDHAKKCLIFNSPNKQEIKLMRILNSMYPDEWKFVGDGQIRIAGKYPDFININGQKKIIELFGERWHSEEEVQERIGIFKPYGYETLIVWVKELQNTNRIKSILRSFCEAA